MPEICLQFVWYIVPSKLLSAPHNSRFPNCNNSHGPPKQKSHRGCQDDSLPLNKVGGGTLAAKYPTNEDTSHIQDPRDKQDDNDATETPVLREILHLRNVWLLGYLRMGQVFWRQVFRKE